MGDSAPAAAAMLFTGSDQSDLAALMGTALDGRYERYPLKDVLKDKLYRKFRSVTLYKPSAGTTTLIIFGHEVSLTGYSDTWEGPRVVLINNSGSEWDLNLADVAFDKRGEAVLLVHTQRAQETRLFWSQAAAPMMTQLAAQLPGEVELDGNPSFGWHAFTEKAPFKNGGGSSRMSDIAAHPNAHPGRGD